MPSTSNQTKVRAEVKDNLLLLTLKGSISKKRLESLYTDIRFTVPDLKPGFIVINDLSEAKIGHLSGIATFKKIMAYLNEQGVAKVIRVVNPESLIVKQVSRIVSLFNGHEPLYATSMEEARSMALALRAQTASPSADSTAAGESASVPST